MLLNQVKASLLGLSTLNAPFTVAGLIFLGLLGLVTPAVSLSASSNQQRIDRSLFWIFGFVLVAFAVLRPIGLARDDLTYVEYIKALCSTPDCLQGSMPARDYAWYYIVKLGLLYQPSDLRVALILSGFGVLIKLLVIDRLCYQRLLALLMYIPLCYLQYDLTQMRAGFAISWMFVGIFFLTKGRHLIGASFLLTNFLFHLQASVSPALLLYRVVEKNVWIFPVGVLLCVILIYTGLYPGESLYKLIAIYTNNIPYPIGSDHAGTLPVGYLILIVYALLLYSAKEIGNNDIVQIASTGLLLGMLFCWVFALVPVVQARVFEFYATTLVLWSGNVGASRIRIMLTCFVALVLYLRLELLNDWILG